jgi:alanyl-tRNA synthetase
MKSSEIREAFLQFFAARGHKVIKSSPLLPKDDPTILFTNAGMNQFKNVFLGLEKRSYKRAATVQKCMRVSGKHNDLETVGRTAKHHTFFEMLGNFSFGDYFKREAIGFAWELVTGVFRVPKDKLYATVYLEDDQAFKIWADEVGVQRDRIFRYGKEDNFWAMGDTGPCGPCSEIHYDLGADIEAGAPGALIEKGSDRFLELWNLVFMEFDRDDEGVLHPLPAPSIDTGMGLERMAAVLQGKRSNFETDLFRPLIEAVAELGKREYPAGDEGDVSVRIIADHIRAISFLIGDGVTPANIGRGYVLRRLIRRAYRQGNLLGIDRPFLFEIVGRVADIMKDAYPELLASIQYVSKVCLSEEERFAYTLSSGLRYFDQVVRETRDLGSTVLPGDKIFKLYDTFGFPVDLSQELAREKGLDVDEAGFAKELEEQKQKARLSWKGDLKQREKRAFDDFRGLKVVSCVSGTGELNDVKILALLKGGQKTYTLASREAGEVILGETPFYAEAGGQVGDTGSLKGARFSALVENTYYLTPELVAHKVKVLSGEMRTGDTADAAVDLTRRQAVSNNHTATHLLHAALRQVLGDHVKQAGSLVSSTRLRFDFSHFSHLSKEEIAKVEFLVNEKIREDIPVEIRETTLEEGIREGATAIFEEKYGEKVRVIGISDFSKELCGGVHVLSTGQIGLFKILSEASIASGMRRIEAVTGEEALGYLRGLEDLMAGVEKSLGASRREVLAKLEKLKDGLDSLEKENRALRKKLAGGAAQTISGAGGIPSGEAFGTLKVQQVKGIPIQYGKLPGLGVVELREMADALRQKMGSGVVFLGATDGEKVYLVATVSKDLTARIQAGALIKEAAPILGGGGGGRPDFAQAGGNRPEELDNLLEMIPGIVKKLAS